MKDNLTLSDQETLAYAREQLREHVSLKTEGYQCTTEQLLDVLLGVAVNQGTLESVCQELTDVCNAETMRVYINEQLTVEGLPALEEELNQALHAEIPSRVLRRSQDVAMDFHDRSYYGKVEQSQGLWVRGKAKDGTTRFYRVATAYVIFKELRYTLAVSFVFPGDSTVEILQRLMAKTRTLGIQIRRLLLDRGFAGIDVLNYLEKEQIPALIACPIRGKQGGTRALCQGRKSYRTQYTFRSNGLQHTAELAVCRVFTTAKRSKRLKRRATWWVFILIHLDMTPKQIRRFYRRRFGIETGYRCANKVRGWTTSRNPAYRFFLMAVSFFLLNVWLTLRWLFTQVPRKGRRFLDTELFQLNRFANFIMHALERNYGYVRQISAIAPPIS